ncbi:MAG: rod shape-determining protein RodA, partial [Bacteroidales bacterium]|nr:rod shape-determining protein RodA [Bacteroidales bacterium]
MKSRESIFRNIDRTTVILYLLMVILGWMNIYAAVYNEEHQSILDMTWNHGKQMVWIATSLLLVFMILLVDVKFFHTFSYIIYLAVLVSLLAVLVLGKEIAGSRSWFQIGGFSLQPSEFAKFATCLALSAYLGRIGADMSLMRTRLTAILIIAIPAALILLQHDTGSALVFASLLLILFREGLPGQILVASATVAVLFILTLLVKPLIMSGIIVALTAASLFLMPRMRRRIMRLTGLVLLAVAFVFTVDHTFEHFLEPHQKKRINVLLGLEKDLKGAGYNVNQSKIAIGSGGFAGKGYLRGTQTKFNFVPEQSTDFIFCTVGEEWGFLGSTVVIGLMIWLLVRLVGMAEKQRSSFSRIYGYGVVSIIFFHFAVNIGMTIGLLPVIGIPLPFFSYGGSSLWGFTILLFIFIKLDSK